MMFKDIRRTQVLQDRCKVCLLSEKKYPLETENLKNEIVKKKMSLGSIYI